MSPMDFALLWSIWIELVKQMIFAVEENNTVGIIHPLGRHGKMIMRSQRVCLRERDDTSESILGGLIRLSHIFHSVSY